MSASSVTNSVISGVTIAMFEDSGWYTFNRGQSFHGKTNEEEPFYWLKGYGCNVYSDKCPVSANACSQTGAYGCSHDNCYKGACATVNFANSCNYMVPFSPLEENDCRVIPSEPTVWQTNAQRWYASKGPGRRCFRGDITDSGSGYKFDANFCYKPVCEGSNTLKVQFGSEWLTCTTNSAKINVNQNGKTGYIQCPKDIANFCSRMNGMCKNDCMSRGRCMKNKQCYCYDGFDGEDCGDRVKYWEEQYAGSTQAFISVEQTGDCKNGGVYNSYIGYCVCNVGFVGPTCAEEDSLTKSYYKAPEGSVTTGGTITQTHQVDQDGNITSTTTSYDNGTTTMSQTTSTDPETGAVTTTYNSDSGSDTNNNTATSSNNTATSSDNTASKSTGGEIVMWSISLFGFATMWI